jgi:hypothetical protein
METAMRHPAPVLLAFALGLGLSVPAAADQLVLTIQNTSDRAVTGFSVFAMDQVTGEAIEDNLGAIIDPIAAGKTHKLQISLFECQKVYLWARFSDGEEITGRTDLCQSRTIRLHD